jgi:hypothetical protein
LNSSGAAPWNFPEPFGGRAIGASIGRAGILVPDYLRPVWVLGEKLAAFFALRSDDTDARLGLARPGGPVIAVVARYGTSDNAEDRI